jgi:hypothetical protein
MRSLDRGQGPYQLRRELVQLPGMVQRKSLECPQTFGRQLQQDTTAVLAVVRTPNQSSLLASHAQLHYAVVPQPQTLSDIANRWAHAVRPSRNLQQELMLLWLKIEFRRGRFAEVEKEP